jgi:hypothetical protein
MQLLKPPTDWLAEALSKNGPAKARLWPINKQTVARQSQLSKHWQGGERLRAHYFKYISFVQTKRMGGMIALNFSTFFTRSFPLQSFCYCLKGPELLRIKSHKYV